jgi:hypothetical protein
MFGLKDSRAAEVTIIVVEVIAMSVVRRSFIESFLSH